MKDLNRLIEEYTRQLQQGKLQLAYKGIFDFIGGLRADLMKRYPNYDISGIYQGYMDMSYFSLTTKPLKERGLKIAIVYLHEKGHFEVWLSARNREISKKYETVFCAKDFDEISLFHDSDNQDSIIEHTLSSAPNFEEQSMLIDTIERGVDKFMDDILKYVGS